MLLFCFTSSEFAKVEGKNEETPPPQFGCLCLGNGLIDFLQILYVNSAIWQTTVQQN